MGLEIASITPYVTAIMVGLAALFVGAINQRHHTIEKRLDELYAPLYPIVWLSKTSFPAHGSEPRRTILARLDAKNYLMSRRLLKLYFDDISRLDQMGQDCFPDKVLDEFMIVVRGDYMTLQKQYLSFWALFSGLFRWLPITYVPSPNESKRP